AARLDTDLERLTVERRAQATPLRVEQIARQQLQMRNPPPGITQYVTATGASTASARQAAQ
ncbi:MAG: cell division protein FtsL, partial [Alcaligenaceae bacterium]